MNERTAESVEDDLGVYRGIRSVATAIELLDCLATEPELGVAELGRRLGVAKSTAHRIVTTLCAKGYVQRVPETKSYRLGIRLHELGELVASRSQLRDHALPLLEQLRNQTGETVHLAVPEGAQMFYVERLESYQGLRFSSRVSRLRPIHLSSSGKAVAAFNPAVADAACAAGFAIRTQRTIRTKQQFLRCLAETRARGYALQHRGGRAGSLLGGGTRARSRRHRPGGDLRRRSGLAGDRRRHRPDGAARAGGRPAAHEHRVGLVERDGLPLTSVFGRSRVVPVEGMTFRPQERFPFNCQCPRTVCAGEVEDGG